MKKAILPGLALLAASLLLSCATAKPLTAAEVEELFQAKDEAALERALPDPERFADPEAAKLAAARLALLKRQRNAAEVEAAIAGKDERFLEKAAAGALDPFLDSGLKRKAGLALADLRRGRLDQRITALAREPDLSALTALLAEPAIAADPALAGRAKRILAAYATPDPKLAAYRGAEMERAVRDLPRKLTDAARANPEKELAPLVAALVKGEFDPFRKAKSLHDWIAYWIAYDTADYFGEADHAQDWASVLRRGTAVCSGYSALFLEMARLAGLEARIVQGHSKGFGYDGRLGPAPDHAWNQVFINGVWHTVDCTWDSGFVDYKTYHRRYSTAYLFLDPRALSYSHLAVPSRDQLLATPVGPRQFEAEPLIRGEFFRLGFALAKELPDLEAVEGEVLATLTNPGRHIRTASSLTGPSAAGGLAERSIVLRRGGLLEIRAILPSAGQYTLRLFARNADEAMPPRSIADYEFSTFIIPEFDRLITEKKASAEEKRLFLEAFESDEDTGRRYFKEDRLNPARTSLVLGAFRKTSQKADWYDSVLELELTCARPEPRTSYPLQYSTYDERGDFKLIEPLYGKLEAGKECRFVVDCASTPELAIIQGGTWLKLKRNGKGLFEGSLVPEPGLSLHLSLPDSDGRYWTALTYEVAP